MQANRIGRRQRGMTLIEVTIVMIVAALVAAASVFGFQNLQRRNEVQDNIALVIEVASDLQRKFGLNNQYGAVTTAVAIQSRTIPPQLRVAGSTPPTANNSYGGAITTLPVTVVSTNDAIALTWSSVPQSQCMDLVIGANNVARRISVAGVNVKPDGGVLNTATLSAQCDTAARVAVVFDIGRMTVS